MGERMRALDWSTTPLGTPDTWPQSLRSVVGMMLPSKASIVIFWGKEYVSLYNDAYIPVFGIKHPGMLGKPGSEAWSEIWEHQLKELLDGVVRTGDAFHGRDLLFYLGRAGFEEETYFNVSYDPIRDETGGVGGVYCIVTETTGRVIGERRLELLREIAARNSTARSARDACVLALEAIAARPHDIPFALAYLNGELQAATSGAVAALAAARREHVRELALPNGKLVVGINHKRPFDAHYSAFLDLVAGQLATAIANAQAYEEERKRSQALAELDRAKTAFFSNVSHEFRTPLTLMLGPIAELLSGDASAAQRQSLELVERNALRLHKLVNTLLDFSRIEAGRVQARFAPLELGVVTADLASAFRSVVERAGLTLSVQCDDAPRGRTFVDREMWEKIVLNLISNAFKHTFEGGISVRLRADAKGMLLSVTDTGVGIPEEQLDKVFDRFHRVPTTQSRTHEGSGIGLALVRELVHLHGGRIEVTSTVGMGSTFEVRIPYGHEHLPAEQVSWLPSAGDVARDSTLAPFVNEAASWTGREAPVVASDLPAPSTVFAGAEILVADDNADMREYISRLLVSAGARVTVAADGRNALRRMQARVPDIVLSDVMMPELDGFGLLAEMRADERLKSVPFVMLSARAGEEARIGGLAAGADDYLVKPFIAKELIARLASQLRLAKASASERRARADADEARREMARVFEQAPVPICVIEGRDLLYTSANASYREIIGQRDPVGKTLLQLWPELAGSNVHNVFQSVLATGTPYTATEFLVQFDQFGTGARRDAFFNFVYHPLKDESGATRGIIAIATDVTPQVLARREADRLRKLAEEANEAKLHLLRTVSHETRQPVHASLGYLDLLTIGVRGELNPQQLSDIENIRRNQNHMLRLLNDILSFAKLEAGALQLDTEEADAAEIIEAVEPLVVQQFRTKGVEYVARRPEAPARFRGDRERTVQVCVNLLTNALKATDPGGRVTLACEINPQSVTLSVSDTGIGIPQAKLQEIFDPFTQLARVRSSADAGGVGLGLSISRQLARAMRGDVTVESSVGSGSTFTFSLPRA